MLKKFLIFFLISFTFLFNVSFASDESGELLRSSNTKYKNVSQTFKGEVIYAGLKYEEFDENCEISVSIVDNEEIRQINKQFRNIDRATDVLSFPMLTFEEGEEAEVNENDEIILGDIIISLERASDVIFSGKKRRKSKISQDYFY